MEQHIKEAILKPREFKSVGDVLVWFRELLDAGLNFHPDDSDYVDEYGEPTFTEPERWHFKHNMLKVRQWCGESVSGPIDPCNLACAAFEQWAADNRFFDDAPPRVVENTIPRIPGVALEQDVARLREQHSAAEILRALAEHERPGVSDESRSNGPSQLERARNHLADQLDELAEDCE